MAKLGRGLSALIPEKKYSQMAINPLSDVNKVTEVDVNLVIPNTAQPRRFFDKEKLQELAESIKKHGVIQPLIAKKTGQDFELIAGERRLRASKIAGLKKVPVIFKKDLSEEQKLELALIENIQREDLNVVEEAEAYRKLMETYDLSQEDLARQTGKSRSAIANKLRILNLPEEILQGLRLKKLTEGHARALLPIKEPKKLMSAYYKLLEEGASVRDTEAKSSKPDKIKRLAQDSEIKKIKNDLEEFLSTKVEIRDKGGKGDIVIRYFSKDELRNLQVRLSDSHDK